MRTRSAAIAPKMFVAWGTFGDFAAVVFAQRPITAIIRHSVGR